MGVISKIILIGKGNYDASEKYELLDYVRYANCSWVAKEPVTGIAPPSDPTETSDKWSLLCRDGEYLGQYPTWNNIEEKPFDTLGDEFVVVNGELSVDFPSNAWEDIADKPFTEISSSFTNDDDVLDVKVDGTTIYKLSDGTLVANASSMGFDIHSLQEETELSNNDEFPFYDASVGGTRKTLWSNIITKLNGIFSKIYSDDTSVVGNTVIKDSINTLNSNNAQNQIAGALAVKDIYQSIAPIPQNAPNYSVSKRYALGDLVKYNNQVYYCITAITTPEAWNPSKWKLWNDNILIRLGVDADGNYGYYKVGADSVTPFKIGELKRETLGTVKGSKTFDIKSLYPDIDLSTISVSNFCIVKTKNGSNSNTNYRTFVPKRLADINVSSTTGINSYVPSLSYSNGVLTATSSYVSASGSASCSGSGTEGTPYSTSSNIGTTYDECTVYFYHVDR